MKKINLGVVGCGVIGRTHIRSAAGNNQCQITAVAELNPALAESVLHEFGVTGAKVFDSALEMLDSGMVEAVVLAIPTAGRRGFAFEAMKRGIHTLIEKPVAMSAGEVEEMISVRGNLVAGCCSSRFRLLPSFRTVYDFLQSGKLGKLRTLHSRNFVSAPASPETPPPFWRLNKKVNGGGILFNWGCYDMDYLLGLTGWQAKPISVSAICWGVSPKISSYLPEGSEAETHYFAFVRCEDELALITERGEYMAAQNTSGWQIIGENGSLTLTMGTIADKKIWFDEITPNGIERSLVWEGDEDAQTILDRPVEDFISAICENRAPMTTLENALLLQRIADKIYESDELHSEVYF